MARPPSKALARLRKGVLVGGYAVLLWGLHWAWELRWHWPRAASDPVPEALLEAVGMAIGGLYMISKGR